MDDGPVKRFEVPERARATPDSQDLQADIRPNVHLAGQAQIAG